MSKIMKINVLDVCETRFREPGAQKVAYGVSAPFGPIKNPSIAIWDKKKKSLSFKI